MKKFITLTAIALMLSAPAANAFNSKANSNANANSNARAHSAASATASQSQGQQQGQLQGQLQGQGQSQELSGNNSSVSIRDRRQAPTAIAPSMSSGHPCAYGGSLGASFVGGAISLGGNEVDNACMLYQSGQIDAANYLLASRDPAACRALRAVGSISDQSTCGDKPAKARASSRSVPSTPSLKTAYTSCDMKDGSLHVGVRRGSSEEMRALAVTQCRAAVK